MSFDRGHKFFWDWEAVEAIIQENYSSFSLEPFNLDNFTMRHLVLSHLDLNTCHTAWIWIWMANDQALLLMVILVHTWLIEADTPISGHFLWAEMEIILFNHFYPPKYAHGRCLRHILDKITKWHFLRTSNEVIWPKKILNFMHGLKSAILAILPEIGRLAGLAMPC